MRIKMLSTCDVRKGRYKLRYCTNEEYVVTAMQADMIKDVRGKFEDLTPEPAPVEEDEENNDREPFPIEDFTTLEFEE